MEIQSAFSAGVQGFQKATDEATKAANAIASESFDAQSIQTTEEIDASASPDISASKNEVTDLNQEVVNLKVAEYQAKASVEVVKSADEALGTLIDVSA